jgi:hypothetical protein
VELAHRIGVDKSVVRRWVSGETRPSDVNLSSLTEIATQQIPAFNRNHWREPPEKMSAVLGLESGSVPEVGGLHTLLPLFATRTQNGLSYGLERYGGLWATIFTVAGPNGAYTLFCSGVLISQTGNQLWAQVSDGKNGIRSIAGPAFVADDMLWLMMEEHSSRNDLCITLAYGAVGRALILDGLYLIRSFVSGSPVCGRGTFFRLADLPADPDEAGALFHAISDRAGELSRSNLSEMLSDGLAGSLLKGSSDLSMRHPFVMALDQASNLATLAIAADMPPSGTMTRRQMVDEIRQLFATELGIA